MPEHPKPWTGEHFHCTCPALPCPMHGTPITEDR